MKITKRVENRTLSYDEFLKQKKYGRYAEARQNAKTVNFGFLFGGSPSVLARGEMGLTWTEEMADAYIKEYKLKNLYLDLEERFGGKYPNKMIKLLTVASHMRTEFFKLYPGLQRRIDYNRSFALENGYVRFVFGGSRNAIAYMWQGAYDKRENAKHISNLANILANADIQNFESSIINQAMCRLRDWLKENNYKSYIFNMVHDSCDFVMYKDESKKVIEKAYEFFEKALDEFKGIPLPVDIGVSDLLAGDYYKHGKEVDNYIV